MEKLQELISKCKCGVYVSVNEHRDLYQTVLDTIPEQELEDIAPAVLEEMKRTDTMVSVDFYPNTPIGFYRIYHCELEKALEMALSTFK